MRHYRLESEVSPVLQNCRRDPGDLSIQLCVAGHRMSLINHRYGVFLIAPVKQFQNMEAVGALNY